MNWQKWVLIGYFVVGQLISVLTLVAQRSPLSPVGAVVSLLVSAVLVWLVVES